VALLALLAALPLGGCVVAAVGAVGSAGYMATQERSAGTVLDDAGIRTGIAARLLDRSGSLYASVSTEVVQGRVLMTGNVGRPEDKIEASRIAWSVHGVREVRNEIEVTDKGGIWNYTKDTWISAQVKTAIIADGDISGLSFSVETNNQVVYITGVAKSQAELDKAINHARNVSGVVRVVPYVVVERAPPPPPKPQSTLAPVEPNMSGATSPDNYGGSYGGSDGGMPAQEPSSYGAPQPLAPSGGRVESRPLN
jgi:osmotically-inducible protein OsmY